jgi:hypothetical protein
MSNLVAGIIGGCAGLWLGILMISIVSVTRRTERENSIYREGFAEGHRIGLRKGKALQRVDVAPGPDSIRPGGKQDTRQTEMTLATAVEILKFVECDIYERIAIRKVIEALRPPE